MPSTRSYSNRPSTSYGRSSSYARGSSRAPYSGSYSTAPSGASSSRSGAVSSSYSRSSFGGKNPETPLFAFIAVCLSALLYTVGWITYVAVGEPVFKTQYATYFFFAMLVASVSVIATIITDFVMVRYRYSMTNLILSLCYCGSAGMVLIVLLILCIRGKTMFILANEEKVGTSPFSPLDVPGVVCWVMSAVAVLLQIVGHYYYN